MLEYYLGLLDGNIVASAIKHAWPEIPIVMLIDHPDLPSNTLQFADALVAKSDGSHFLWATVHFLLAARRLRPSISEQNLPRQNPNRKRLRSWVNKAHVFGDEKEASFSPRIWRGIRNGTIRI